MKVVEWVGGWKDKKRIFLERVAGERFMWRGDIWIEIYEEDRWGRYVGWGIGMVKVIFVYIL